jgi:hypothetical protein
LSIDGFLAENVAVIDDENPSVSPKHVELDSDLLGENPNAAWRDKDLVRVRKGAV